ncbi:MAG: hypothetical protein A2636_01245 [Elusimicrobia bacterium RIFCSPHIGHO2_01_FULL_64_10]|nr:MAG: hypothetical protein A2636_01245 [Elusimicrobia bacterium RIFCSPHIGHO2_01_FULL_64_10]
MTFNDDLKRELTAIRRQIHRYPELGGREFRTAGLVERTLRSWGIPSRRLTPTGIVAVMPGRGRCVALRADMDALPLAEDPARPYASRNPGAMHACGHDAHVAMLLGAARILSRKKRPAGTVKFFFQPNEEGAGGAKSMISKGAMDRPKVDAVFGLHVNPRLPAGTVGVKAGPVMAAVDRFEISVLGKGGHAAYPHEGRDALFIASEIVVALQSVVSRDLDPVEPAVLTVGTFNSGTGFNILAGTAVLTGTVRTLSEKAHGRIPRVMRRIVHGICRAHGARAGIKYERIGSVLRNSRALAELARDEAVRLFGPRRVRRLESPSMGGEDFSEYLRRAPGCFIYIGTAGRNPDSRLPWHHPRFDIDESALPAGSELLARLAESSLGHLKR